MSWRSVRNTVGGALVALASGCGPSAAVDGPAASATLGPAAPKVVLKVRATARGDEVFSPQVIEATQAKVLAALAEGPGLVLPRHVPAVYLTSEQALARRKAYTASLEEAGGLAAGIDVVADFVFADSMLGRYLPDEKVLYILSNVLERLALRDGELDPQAAEVLLFGVMAHELVHAYDDQVHGIMPDPAQVIVQAAADGSKLAELQTRMSLLEGRATFIAELACEHAGVPPMDMFSIEEARDVDVFRVRRDDNAALAAGKGLANVVARAKLMQYAYGREFSRRAWAFGGEKFFKEIIEHSPLSLAELEDFSLFVQRWAAEEEAALEAADAAAPPAAAAGADAAATEP